MNLFRTKSIAALQAMAQESGLKKTLSAFDLVCLGIGCVIGTGIFVLTGVAAAEYAGPGVALSFLLSGIVCAFVALAYAEFASMIPSAGSAYTYTYTALGEMIAFICGWNLILEYMLATSAVASGWGGYMTGLFKAGGIHLPEALTLVPAEGGIMNLPAMLILVFLAFLLVRGTHESAAVTRLLVFVKLAAIFIFLVLAVPNIEPTNWDPFLPFGWEGVSAGAAIAFFAFIGFDAVATSAEECKNPGRDLPIGIVGSLAVCTILYVAVSATLTGVVPYTLLDNAEPVAFALRHIGYNIGSALVAVGAIAGITSVLLVLLYGMARIVFAMSRDGMLPPGICKVHSKYKTPYLVTIIGATIAGLGAGFFPIGLIAEMVNIGTLAAFFIASIGVLVLRFTQPNIERKFRCPALIVVAPLAALSCAYLMYNLPWDTWVRFGIWTVLGFATYFLYSYRHSKLGKGEAE